MSRHSTFPEALFVSLDAPTFASVLERVRSHEDLAPLRRRDLTSSITRLAEVICPGRPLSDIPADPEWCHIRITKIRPAAIGIAPKTWANMTSNFAKALEVAGVRGKRFTIPLTGHWAELWAKVRAQYDMQLTSGMSRFPRFCQQTGVQPESVTNDTVVAYASALTAGELTRSPEKSVYCLVRSWNLAADLVPGWPSVRLTQPDRSRRYALPWASFPAGLAAEVDKWLALKSSDDIFDMDGPRQALSTGTVKLRKGSLQRYASALVHDGVPIEELTDLRVLVQPEMVKRGLKWLMARDNLKIGGGVGNIAISITMAAKHAVQLEGKALGQLEGFSRRLSKSERGMTVANSNRMEVFKDKAMLVALLRLPETLCMMASKLKDPKRRAAQIETALAIALLTSCPIRFGNLCNLETDRHLIRLGHRQNKRMLLQLPREMVKNHVDLKFEVPPAIANLIDEFINAYRPEIAATPSRFLFTKRSDDAPISLTTLRVRICEAIRKHLEAELTPHNFRHLAGLIVLSQYPGGYETVRRLLGHKSGSTTLDHYVGLETDAAQSAYTDLLATLKGSGNG